MPKKLNIFVSAVLITDSHTVNARSRVTEATKILKHNYANYEVIVIDNGLRQEELGYIKGILKTTSCIRVIRLAKVADIDTAIFAGVEASIGDYTCILYNSDPIKLIPEFIGRNQNSDIVFGLAKNLKRKSFIESMGARIFYWYHRKYLLIDIPMKSTYFMSLSRGVANALTRSGRQVRHIRHLAKQVGFNSTNLNYSLPSNHSPYTHTPNTKLLLKALDILSNYSNHPLRVLTYFGIFASLLNVFYAAYIVIVNLAIDDIQKGWTTLSLQSSLMFFLLFMIMAILSEYIGKILTQTRNEPPYHIMQELSSTVSVADESRRNVTK